MMNTTRKRRSGRATGRKRNLVVELGTEELPPKALKNLAESFAEHFYSGLVTAGLVEPKPDGYVSYATPRRLAVWVKGVLPKQPDKVEQRRGPALQAAFDDHGEPTAAAQGFARSCNVAVSKLGQLKTEQGAWLVHQKKIKGDRLNVVVSHCLQSSVNALPIPKRMRWGDEDAEFVRPVHWLLALYGSDLVKTQVLGIKANRFTHGHRFHCPDQIRVPSADRYCNTLKTNGYVIANFQVRRGMIEKQVARLAKKENAKALIDPKLLDEVTGLVEWPVAVVGGFDTRFLKLPREVLVSTMADHQKYFYLVNDKNKPVPKFITISNIKSRSPKRVRQGNERVLRARLSDAEFFWKSDQSRKLEDRSEELKGILFHKSLGSIYDKTRRVEKLALSIGRQLVVDADEIKQAARLCKADLVTDMVAEFPELQGTIGRYYALNQGLSKPVARAIDSHYQPRFAGDKLPSDSLSQTLALADRIDTLVGIFGSGEIPSGDKDPFALRRAALGVMRILIERKLDLDLMALLTKCRKIYAKDKLKDFDIQENTVDLVFDFMLDRLKGYFQNEGLSADEYSAVQACRPTNPLDFSRRIRAVNQFFNKRKSAASSLAAANKRIANILGKSDISANPKLRPDRKLMNEAAELALAKAVTSVGGNVKGSFTAGDYETGLEQLAALRTPVDEFFDQVMVMHKNESIKRNRLILLSSIRNLFLGVADISKIRLD